MAMMRDGGSGTFAGAREEFARQSGAGVLNDSIRHRILIDFRFSIFDFRHHVHPSLLHSKVQHRRMMSSTVLKYGVPCMFHLPPSETNPVA